MDLEGDYHTLDYSSNGQFKGFLLQLTEWCDKFCYKHLLCEIQEIIVFYYLNFTIEDGNDGAMFPETISPKLLHAS
jgi:hypothetical protein